jgi:glycosyltransferase involved in cell wall biosynthesis
MAGSRERHVMKPRIVAEPYIMFLGPLDPRKQPEVLVGAYGRSQARLSHKLLLVGPDSYGYGGQVVDAIDRLKLRDRVILFGPAQGAEKWQLLSQARCLCLPSRAEGFPLVLCEALGAGLPMIISRECNFTEAADAGAAIEVETPEESAWARALDEVCLNDKVHGTMVEAAQRLAEGYTWEHVIDMWVELYQSLAREQAAG